MTFQLVFCFLLSIFFIVNAAPTSNSNPWGSEAITFSVLNNPPNLTINDVETVLAKAFNTWSSVIPLNFQNIESNMPADITITFGLGDHGDDSPFNETNSVHAIPYSEIHFKADTDWQINQPGLPYNNETTDFYYNSLFGVGSVLGLKSSNDPTSVMYEGYEDPVDADGNYLEPKLTPDDVQNIQQIYGERKQN